MLPVYVDPTRSKRLTVAILGFQFGLYHIVIPLSFLLSNEPCVIVMLIVTFLRMINIQIPLKIPITMSFISLIPHQHISPTHQVFLVTVLSTSASLGVTSRIRRT